MHVRKKRTFLLRFFSMLSTANTCSPAAGSSIFQRKRGDSPISLTADTWSILSGLALLFPFFPLLLLLWCEGSPSSSASSCFRCDSSLAFSPRRLSLCRRVGAAARKHFMQIAVDVTFHHGGGDWGWGLIAVLLSGAVGKKRNHEFRHLAREKV